MQFSILEADTIRQLREGQPLGVDSNALKWRVWLATALQAQTCALGYPALVPQIEERCPIGNPDGCELLTTCAMLRRLIGFDIHSLLPEGLLVHDDPVTAYSARRLRNNWARVLPRLLLTEHSVDPPDGPYEHKAYALLPGRPKTLFGTFRF